jgi:general nucleoside transport system permease protein
MDSIALLLATSLNAGTVLAIAALGLLINEKAGIVNLGAEGMMLCARWPVLPPWSTPAVSWPGLLAGMAAARAGPFVRLCW